MNLQFTLKNQVINRTDRNTVVSSSKNYLYAKFVFLSEDWKAPVTVIFGKYSVLLDSENKCLVPWEVLENPGSFTVSAFCGDLQTANTVSVYVEKSGYIQGETPEEPTPDVYTQLAGMVQDAIERADAATEAATGAVEKTEGFAAEAEKSAISAAQSELSAAEAATAAGSMATNAAASAQAAQQSAEQAAQVVAGAGQIVKDAETAALAAVNEAEAAAVSTVNQAGQAQVDTVNQAGTSALSEISEAKTDALNSIDTATNDAVNTIIESRNEAVQGAETAIENSKNQAVSDVQNAGQSAVSAAETAQTAANTATTKATEAAQSATDAKTSADSIKDLIPVPTAADNGKVLTVVDSKWSAIAPWNSWEDVQTIVRSGLAPQYFPVGYEFTTYDSTENTNIVWRVVGYDTIKAADESLTHSMVLETKYGYSTSTGTGIPIPFDAAEHLYYAETGLEAGTYSFTLIPDVDTSYGGGKTYSFTLANAVPAGGAIAFPWGFGIQAASVKISSYASLDTTEPIETVDVTEGETGTVLGIADGTAANMNYQDRIRYGSNNYAQSAVRQWLNSGETADNVWTAQTKFDKPSELLTGRAGFMAGLPTDFLAVVKPAVLPCYTNKIFETASIDGTQFATKQSYTVNDTFFLLSRTEMYGTFNNQSVSDSDGEQLDFYKDLTNAERIKYDVSGTAKTAWGRSNTEFTTYSIYNDSSSSGAISSGTAHATSYIVCPACIIA